MKKAVRQRVIFFFSYPFFDCSQLVSTGHRHQKKNFF